MWPESVASKTAEVISESPTLTALPFAGGSTSQQP